MDSSSRRRVRGSFAKQPHALQSAVHFDHSNLLLSALDLWPPPDAQGLRPPRSLFVLIRRSRSQQKLRLSMSVGVLQAC